MKVGDLVNFHTEAWVFAHENRKRANPGLVVSVSGGRAPGGTDPINGRVVAKVLWSDGTYTQEHSSYLRPVDEVYTPDQEINS